MAPASKPRGWQLADRLWIMGTPHSGDVERLGITAVVRVARRPVDPAVASVAAVRHVPLPDGARVDSAAVMNAARAAELLWRRGETVLITCMAGRNRSALVAAVALVRLALIPPDSVVAHIRACRPRALDNPHALAWLERWLTLTQQGNEAL